MRGRLSLAIAVFAAGLVLSACGSKTHENAPRPPLPELMSISVAQDSIEVSPRVVGLPGRAPANISQNANAPRNQADEVELAPVVFAISNLTNRSTKLFIEGPKEAATVLTPMGSGPLNITLPDGIYRLSSPASRVTTRFAVGSSRVSSGSDLLTP